MSRRPLARLSILLGLLSGLALWLGLWLPENRAGGGLTVAFSPTTYKVNEKDLKVVVTVTISGAPSSMPVNVDCMTAMGTAGSGDFTPGTYKVVFPKGSSAPQSFEVKITDDALPEDDEQFTIDITTVTGGATVASGGGKATVTILANDGTPPVVSFSPDPVYVGEGDTAIVTPTVTPSSDASKVSYKIANTAIATVAPSGTDLIVTGVAAGTTQLQAVFQLEVIASVDVHVIKLDLEIYKPKVIDPMETMIPEADELTKGSQTFEDLDNDDNDIYFDDVDAKVDGGNNEMVKIRLKLKPNNLKEGVVKLDATAGAGNILVYTSNELFNAVTEYKLGTGLKVPDDFVVEGDWLVKTLWVYPKLPHTAQQGTKLKMTYDKAPKQIDEVALTIIGIDKIEWKGKGNSIKHDDMLDADPHPNYPTGLSPPAVRVFPDARIKDGKVEVAARDKVDVQVTLTVQPVEPLKVYFKSFDVDDPTAPNTFPAEPDPIDGETDEKDNRGSPKDGTFPGAIQGVLEKTFIKITEPFEFQVTMQPGDNFRIVGNGDKAFFDQLENHDTMLHSTIALADPKTLIQNVADKMRITSKYVAGNPAEREIRKSNQYATIVLTVWRFLHVERDHMGNPGPGETFDGAGKGNDDVAPVGPVDPDISLMQTNYEPAYIYVLDDLTGLGGLNTTTTIAFVHNLSMAAAATTASRQVPSEERFWVTNIVGSYEGPADPIMIGPFFLYHDNDPDGEGNDDGTILGVANGDDGPCHIYLECIRDLRAYRAAQNAKDPKNNLAPVALGILEKRVVLHESAHRFNMRHGLPPGDDGPLHQENNLYGDEAANRFTPLQLHVIRSQPRPR